VSAFDFEKHCDRTSSSDKHRLMKRRNFLAGSFASAALVRLPPLLAQAQAQEQEFPNAPGLTKHVAEFIVNTRYEEIPPEVLTLGRKSILDGFGLALSGSVSEMGPLVRQYLSAYTTASAKSSVVGSRLRVPARFAALANGIFIHADDYDDTQLSVAPDRIYGLLTHPTVPVLPAVFAFSEANGVTGKDLTIAYHVGVEVECKIAEAISPRHYGTGFHTTGTIGTFGSAAACAKLMKFDVSRTAKALAIAASEAAGLRNNFGSMTKPFHAGRASESGVVACELAALGWTASEEILESRNGFFDAAGGGFDPRAILNKLAKPWTFTSPGISIKPFPSGSLTHPAMGEMQRLIREHNITAADVEKVDMGGNSGMMGALLHHRPTNALQAKFSMEFCMAILLLDRKAGLTEFTDPVVQRPDVQDMLRRVNFYVDAEAEKAGLNKMTSLLRIHLKGGRTISGRAEFAKGHPSNPMSYEEEAEKFRGCAQFAKWPAAKADSVIQTVKNLEAEMDVRKLTAALTMG
jgi:2-methylcitrate dehydratase PrpD